jgi:hypothetical protein
MVPPGPASPFTRLENELDQLTSMVCTPEAFVWSALPLPSELRLKPVAY